MPPAMESTGAMKYVSLPRAKRGRVAGVGAPSTSASASCFTAGSGFAGASGVRAGATWGAACSTGASVGAGAGVSAVCARAGADTRTDASVHASARRDATGNDGFMRERLSSAALQMGRPPPAQQPRPRAAEGDCQGPRLLRQILQGEFQARLGAHGAEVVGDEA